VRPVKFPRQSPRQSTSHQRREPADAEDHCDAVHARLHLCSAHELQNGGRVLSVATGGERPVDGRDRLSGVCAVQDGLVRLEEREDDRAERGDQELRDNDEDVMDALESTFQYERGPSP
jgi:hypothetical protein